MTTLAAEAETRAAADEEQSPRASTVSEAWERFLQERALESGSRPLRPWRDEEGL
jgi:hypothetical protein